MPRDMFEDRLMRSKNNRYKWEDQVCEGITITDLEEQRIRGGECVLALNVAECQNHH